jgi:hypothetical protein
MEQRWNDTDRGKKKTRRKTCPNADFSTANPSWAALGANPDRRSEKLATNCLSYGKALLMAKP